MNKLLAFIRLTRPLNLFQGAIAILVCATLMQSFPSLEAIVLAVLIVWCFTAAGNALNDYCDVEIDLINRPDRPIPSGKITRQTALAFSIALFVIGAILTVFILTPAIGIVVAVAVFLLITYSVFFKKRAFWGNFIVAALLGLTFIFAALIFGDVLKGIAPFFLAFGFNLVREIVKDMQDVRGDRTEDAHTIPLQYGMRVAQAWVVWLTLMLMACAFLPYFLGVYGIYYLIVLAVAVELPLAYVIYSIRKDVGEANCGRLARVLKVDVFIGLIAIFVGRF
ncbi:MAG: geranylgeranylglycerol-phosphate geranylgeranyltransferase [Candidatus Neomarinimicrobiota bacterium]